MIVRKLSGLARVVGVIPARMKSERLPGKPLRPIYGHPMIAWVYHRARTAECLDRLLVATDSDEIVNYCRAQSIPVEPTSAGARSGTDRVVEIMARAPADIYVNIQGDEPMVTGEHVELVLSPFRETAETEVSTLKVALDPDLARDPNNVKVVCDAKERALYFSRSLLPYDRRDEVALRTEAPASYFKHLGLYAYSAAALQKFAKLPPSILEHIEKLEQLRFLENGIAVRVVETAQDTIGVDTEEDLLRVEAYFRNAGATLAAK